MNAYFFNFNQGNQARNPNDWEQWLRQRVGFEAFKIHFRAWFLCWKFILVYLECFFLFSLAKQYVKMLLKTQKLKKKLV